MLQQIKTRWGLRACFFDRDWGPWWWCDRQWRSDSIHGSWHKMLIVCLITYMEKDASLANIDWYVGILLLGEHVTTLARRHQLAVIVMKEVWVYVWKKGFICLCFINWDYVFDHRYMVLPHKWQSLIIKMEVSCNRK